MFPTHIFQEKIELNYYMLGHCATFSPRIDARSKNIHKVEVVSSSREDPLWFEFWQCMEQNFSITEISGCSFSHRHIIMFAMGPRNELVILLCREQGLNATQHLNDSLKNQWYFTPRPLPLILQKLYLSYIISSKNFEFYPKMWPKEYWQISQQH